MGAMTSQETLKFQHEAKKAAEEAKKKKSRLFGFQRSRQSWLWMCTYFSNNWLKSVKQEEVL